MMKPKVWKSKEYGDWIVQFPKPDGFQTAQTFNTWREAIAAATAEQHGHVLTIRKPLRYRFKFS